MQQSPITLGRHIIEEEHRHHPTTGELSRLLMQVAFVAKILAREIGRAALVGQLGLVGEKNPTGDSQKKLDVFANQTAVEAFAETGLVAGLVSEELAEVKEIATGAEAKYWLFTDPLDGSSNTDINGSMGTIFGIYRLESAQPSADKKPLLRKGAAQVVAGYVLYGTSTMLVYTSGHGVNGFTLDRELGEFLLSHENIKCPARGRYYSANLGHFYEWAPGVRKYIEYAEESDPPTGRPMGLRYSGALVADLHRILMDGGIYLYPADNAHRDGKLRLTYECAPLAFVVEQAGGRASTGRKRILEIEPESIHQKSQLAIGSTQDVLMFEKFVAEAKGVAQ
ncbi:MAG: class 1 fructose-bisphosphatase [Acidobacteriales bacterium]|nr:class 1 fructose-bisphosphatase [Terriglobales bacterium]